MPDAATTAIAWLLAAGFAAALVAFPILLVMGVWRGYNRLVNRLAGVPRAIPPPIDPDTGEDIVQDGDGRVWRRCDNCHTRWRATPGHDLSAFGVRLRRSVRRVTRRVGWQPHWAAPHGWS